MSEIKIGPREIYGSLIKPVEKSERSSPSKNNQENQNKDQQQRTPKEEGKGDFIDIEI